jgi:Tol biopolymer transport system component
MAYLEGQTLEQLIAESPLKIDDALDMAAQIGKGLAEAHGKGVYHRDIKPSNAILLEKGAGERLVKIMDFGLAHLTGQSKLTQKDTSLGTPAYMSPDQAEGRPTDHRTDIWSLGVVLYEMIVGQMPFRGEYQQAIIYSILHEDYEPVTALRAGVPMELEWIVGKCLEKDTARRYQSAGELVVDLENQREKLKSGKSRLSRNVAQASATQPSETQASAKQAVGTGSPAGPSHPPAEPASVATGSLAGQGQAESLSLPAHTAAGEAGKTARVRLAWAAAALFAIAAIAFALTYFNQPAPQPETTRFVIHPPEGVRFGSREAEISPDGRHLAFTGISDAGEQRLWVRSPDSLEARPLSGTERAEFPFWSLDSRFIGFFAEGKFKKISVDGGPAQTLSEATEGSGGTWAQGSSGSDGVVVFAPTGSSAFLRISDAGGEPNPVTVLDESAHRWPHFLPDGRHFLYWGGRAGGGQVYTGSLDPGAGRESASATKTPLLPDDTPVRYAPPSPDHPNGHLLFAREDTLMAQEFDASRMVLAGQPFPIVEGIAASTLRVGLSDFSVSQTGVLAYRTGTDSAPHQLVWFDRDGKPLGSVGEPGRHGAVSLSLDNTKAAISLLDFSRDIWIYDLTRNGASRFTFDPASDMTHTWSPDGRRLVFSSTRDGAFNL